MAKARLLLRYLCECALILEKPIAYLKVLQFHNVLVVQIHHHFYLSHQVLHGYFRQPPSFYTLHSNHLSPMTLEVAQSHESDPTSTKD